MNDTNDLIILVNVCIEAVTLFEKGDNRKMNDHYTSYVKESFLIRPSKIFFFLFIQIDIKLD